MKTKIYILVLVFLAIMGILNAQTDTSQIDVKLNDLNSYFWNAYADKLHLTKAERSEFLLSHQKNNTDFQQKQNKTAAPVQQLNSKNKPSGTVFAGPCTNIDFETGTMSNWVASCGFHPLYAANPSGCCLNPGGQQTIMTGTGLDPAGNFPVVAPGGNFSLRLGNNQTGGQADRVEQTFQVTSLNANFTYRYAVVMEDPGHIVTQQPSFLVEMLDSLGGLIPCTFYNVAAGNNIPGFINSTTMANVVYKPWSSVVADLTALIGQNITIRFTATDCSLGGHFGYAYIDGNCLSFITGSNDTICAGTQKSYCAPNGFLSTTWNGPGIVNNTSQCINASAPGIYTCLTVLIPGCPGPTFTYTLSNFPLATVAFNSTAAGACSTQYAFNNTSTISVGTISSYTWTMGSNSSFSTNASQTFPGPGSYAINLLAKTDKGCVSNNTQTITIYPFPIANFSAPSSCMRTNVLFNNTSSISLGSLSSYTWNFGNGNFSNNLNPSFSFTSSGSFPVSLSVTSNQNCVATQTNTISIFQKPTASFNQFSLSNCSQQFTFTNTSGISVGSITGYNWNFGVMASTLQNPVNNFAAPGNYLVSLIVTSNNNCKDTVTKTLNIYPFPAVGLLAQSVCLNSPVNFTNTSTISLGSINSYTWNFGNSTGSNLTSPSANYLNSGTYTVTLSATSNQNCVSVNTISLSIYPLPTASISAANLCKGNITSFSNNSSISAGSIVSYAWDFGDGNVSNTPLPFNQYSGSGTYPVSLVLTSNQNCVRIFTNNITIHPLPLLSFSVANVCHGNNSQFTNNSSIISGSINSYTWTFGNAVSSSLTNPVINYLNAASYVVSLSGKSNQNCVNTLTNTVVIHPLPVISFSASNVCFGDTTLFTNNNSIASGSITSFNWNFGDGNSSNLLSPGHTYLNYGNKQVSLSAISDQNCPATYTANVFINPLPLITFSVNNVCLGSNSNFLNSSSIPLGSITSWVWNYGNTVIANGTQNPSYQYPLAGSYTVTLKGTSNKNCSNTATRVLSVFSNPLASFLVKNVCLGEISTYTNTSSIPAPEQITSYIWNLGDGSSSNFISPAVTYANGGNYSIKLTATSANNCSNSVILPMSVYYLPQVGFIPTSACKDQATQFTNQTTLASGFISSSRWDFENDGTWDDTLNINPVKTYPTHGTFSCKLEVESNYHCRAAKTKDVTVHGNPVADFSTRAVCLGDHTSFVNHSSSVEGAITSYQWDFNGDNIIDNVSKDATTTYTANGTYLVKLEVQTQFGCSNVKSMSGRINAMPVPAFVSKNNKGCPMLNVQFQNTSGISSGSIVKNLWSFDDGTPVDYLNNPSHTFDVGDYDVSLTVISDSGCSATLRQPGFVTVYPKPVAGFVVNPEEIDENEPLGNISTTAQNAVFTSYFINDGSRINAPNCAHNFKNLSETKPMIVQIVKNEFGCADTLTEILKVKPAFVIYVPNTFTPNGDGRNDEFQAKGVGIVKYNMQIFDRWGHKLFESNEITNAWDGTVRGGEEPIMQDTYVWKAKVMDLFNKAHDLEGHITLLR